MCWNIVWTRWLQKGRMWLLCSSTWIVWFFVSSNFQSPGELKPRKIGVQHRMLGHHHEWYVYLCPGAVIAGLACFQCHAPRERAARPAAHRARKCRRAMHWPLLMDLGPELEPCNFECCFIYELVLSDEWKEAHAKPFPFWTISQKYYNNSNN